MGKCIRMREDQDDDNAGMQNACDDVDDDIKLFLAWIHCVGQRELPRTVPYKKTYTSSLSPQLKSIKRNVIRLMAKINFFTTRNGRAERSVWFKTISLYQ